MSLVMWILVFKCGLIHLKCYTDDVFSFSTAGNLTFYPPYNWWMPSEQVIILHLWDEIRLPHENTKQISGTIIPSIGFEVNPNLMTVTMIPTKWESLIEACQLFVTPGRRFFQDFQWLAGHINWALNVYPRLRPALSALYAKITGKSCTFASICINNNVCQELAWFTNHIKHSDGVHFLKSGSGFWVNTSVTSAHFLWVPPKMPFSFLKHLLYAAKFYSPNLSKKPHA